MDEFMKVYTSALKEYAIPEGITFEWGSEERMARIFEYCVIMRTTEGIEDYLNAGIDGKVECLKNKIAEVLGLPDTTSEISLSVIEAYLKEKVIEDGYVAHTTNSKSAFDIMAYGLSFDENARNTTAVLEEMKEIFPEGFFRTDLNYLNDQKNDRAGWYYDRTPLHFARYKNGPEWFKRLTNGAYSRRDYEGAIAFVAGIMDYYQESDEKKSQAIAFLNKYWQIYAPTTPHLLLVSTKNQDLRSEREKAYVEQLPREERIRYYTETYFRVTNQSSKKFISPESIIDIDFNKIVKEYQESGTKAIK